MAWIHAPELDFTFASVHRVLGSEPGVRAVGIRIDSDMLRLRAYLDREPDEEISADLDACMGEVLADLRDPVSYGALLEVARLDPARLCEEPAALVGPVGWQKLRDAATAARILEAGHILDGQPEIGERADQAWRDELLRRVRDTPPRWQDYDGEQPISFVERDERTLALSSYDYTWISSHQQGWRETRYATIPTRCLPEDLEVAAAWVRAATEVYDAPRTPVPDEPLVCALCAQTIAALDFDKDHGICHACGERHLGWKF